VTIEMSQKAPVRRKQKQEDEGKVGTRDAGGKGLDFLSGSPSGSKETTNRSRSVWGEHKKHRKGKIVKWGTDLAENARDAKELVRRELHVGKKKGRPKLHYGDGENSTRLVASDAEKLADHV